ncbi:hypothetical protein BH09PSE6_BH09PSE6_01820 [soil metagenome]
MKLLKALAAGNRHWSGSGTNHESERFTGRLVIQPIVNDRAVLLHFTATRLDGLHLHRESTLLGVNVASKLCLWPVMEELPFVAPHVETVNETTPDGATIVVFSSGPRDDVGVFREQLTIELRPDGSLVYAHSWGMPGGHFGDRSSCALQPEP